MDWGIGGHIALGRHLISVVVIQAGLHVVAVSLLHACLWS